MGRKVIEAKNNIKEPKLPKAPTIKKVVREDRLHWEKMAPKAAFEARAGWRAVALPKKSDEELGLQAITSHIARARYELANPQISPQRVARLEMKIEKLTLATPKAVGVQRKAAILANGEDRRHLAAVLANAAASRVVERVEKTKKSA